jgi:DNA repair protein RadC
MSIRTLRVTYSRNGGTTQDPAAPIRTSLEAAKVLTPFLEAQPVEVFGVLCLTTRYDPLAFHEVSRGSLDATTVHPREVFKAAVLINAAAIIVGHNHPSGDPQPSADDCQLTERLRRAGELLGIPLIDHVVIGHGGRFYSFVEHGQFDCTRRIR